jgi:hypothetical protein
LKFKRSLKQNKKGEKGKKRLVGSNPTRPI